MDEIAVTMIQEIADSDKSTSEKLRMYFWIQKYLWGLIEKALDEDGR